MFITYPIENASMFLNSIKSCRLQLTPAFAAPTSVRKRHHVYGIC